MTDCSGHIRFSLAIGFLLGVAAGILIGFGIQDAEGHFYHMFDEHEYIELDTIYFILPDAGDHEAQVSVGLGRWNVEDSIPVYLSYLIYKEEQKQTALLDHIDCVNTFGGSKGATYGNDIRIRNCGEPLNSTGTYIGYHVYETFRGGWVLP